MARIPEQSGSTLAARVTGVDARASELERHTEGWTNVRSYGAVGDGAEDDVAAIQAALDSGSKNVYAPTGSYRITGKLLVGSGQMLRGDGPNATVLVSDSVSADGVEIRDATWAEVRDLAITSTQASASGHGLVIQGGGANKASNVRVDGFSDGVRILSSGTVALEDVYVTGSSATGLHILTAGGVPTVGVTLDRVRATSNDGDGVVIEGLVSDVEGDKVSSESNGGDGLRLTSNADGVPSQVWLSRAVVDSNEVDGLSLLAGNMLHFTDPWVSNRGSGKNFLIGADVVDVQVTAGKVYNCTGHGIEVAGTTVSLIGTSVDEVGYGASGAYDGVYVTGSKVDILSVKAGAGARYGLHLATGASEYRVVGGQYSGDTAGVYDSALDPSSSVAVSGSSGSIALGTNVGSGGSTQLARSRLTSDGYVRLSGQLLSLSGTIASGATLGTLVAAHRPNRNVLTSAIDGATGAVTWMNITVDGVITSGIDLAAGSSVLYLDAASFRLVN